MKLSLLYSWMNGEIYEIESIHQILSNAEARAFDSNGEKAFVIWRWLKTVHRKIVLCKALHRQSLNEAISLFQHQHAQPHDMG